MAKRITSSTARWSFIAESMLPQDQQRISALKAVSDKFSREIAEKPTELPKIDWKFYQSKISVPGMVDAFQKGYETLRIPYPSDQGALAATEQSNTKMIDSAEKKYKQLLEKIDTLKKSLEEKEAVMNYSEMTLEELMMAKPEFRNHGDTPKFWPHLLLESRQTKKELK